MSSGMKYVFYNRDIYHVQAKSVNIERARRVGLLFCTNPFAQTSIGPLAASLPPRSVSRRGFIHIVESPAATNVVAFKLDASFPLAEPLSRRDRYIGN